jgi:hypothetical protein
MPASVAPTPQAPAVGPLPCASAVKTPFTLVALLHGTRAVPARPSPTRRTNVTHRRLYVGHQDHPFSTLRASPNSVRLLKTCVHTIFGSVPELCC